MSCRPEESAIPAAVSLLPLATNHASDVLDMPVDPNEPTYCLCHQVSYGEMIGCDNQDVCAFSCLLTAFLLCPSCRSAKYCNQYVCMSVCPQAYLKNRSFKVHEIFCKCYPGPWLSPPLITVEYDMYWRFCGWRHVFAQWAILACGILAVLTSVLCWSK